MEILGAFLILAGFTTIGILFFMGYFEAEKVGRVGETVLVLSVGSVLFGFVICTTATL